MDFRRSSGTLLVTVLFAVTETGDPVRGEKPEGGRSRGPLTKDFRGNNVAEVIGEGRIGESCIVWTAGEFWDTVALAFMLFEGLRDIGRSPIGRLDPSGVFGSG